MVAPKRIHVSTSRFKSYEDVRRVLRAESEAALIEGALSSAVTVVRSLLIVWQD
jgi:hypothetical protein